MFPDELEIYDAHDDEEFDDNDGNHDDLVVDSGHLEPGEYPTSPGKLSVGLLDPPPRSLQRFPLVTQIVHYGATYLFRLDGHLLGKIIR